MARGKRYTEEQILKVLQEIEGGASVATSARSHGITEQTIYRWRDRYAGVSKSDLVALKSLQEENRRLRSVVADRALGIEAYTELQWANGKSGTCST
jgi:putative transposase